MPRITGSDAKQYFIKYTCDQYEADGTTRQVFKKRVTARHIHWLATIDTLLLPTAGLDTLKVMPKEVKARKIRLSNGVKGFYLVFPSPTHDIWKKPLETFAGTYYTLDDIGSGYQITGRIGEKDSRPTAHDYTGVE